ncbi:MAG: hypothetical protein IPM18_11880 [Phycisphaerales bacterium]|nr:hypothetical protein [Phycisphaerales bacterium]
MSNKFVHRLGWIAGTLAALFIVFGSTGCAKKERRTVVVEEREHHGEVREVPPGDEMIVE